MLINAQRPQELRVAIVDGAVMEEYQVAVAESGLTRGNIYRAIVQGIQPNLGAAFVDYGAPKHAFLKGDDVVEDAYHRQVEEGSRHPRVERILERGKPVLVQVTKDPSGEKGAAVTTNVSLAGRYLVLMPFSDSRGISRKVEDDATRRELRELAEKLEVPNGFGFIIRTNALGQNKTALNRDLNALLRLWKRIRAEYDKGKGPRLLYSDQDLIIQAVRDLLDSSMDEVLVDDDEAFEKVQSAMRSFMPRARTKVERYRDRMPLFSRFKLEDQIEAIFKRTVPLPTGGSIVIEGTEALTAIDVNSGRSSGSGGQEEMVLRTNLEAAEEVARQLKLRDIGGLIVVDFIDMRSHKNRRSVEKAVRDAVKSGRARFSVSKISDNGLLEINRQRLKTPLVLRTHRLCPTCGGGGRIPSPETVSLNLMRRIEERAAVGDLRGVRVELHPELADDLQNEYRRDLADIEREFDIHIEIIANNALHRSEEDIEWFTGRQAAPPPGPAVRVDELAAAPARGETSEDDDSEGGETRSRRRRRGGRRRKRSGESVAATSPPEPTDRISGSDNGGNGGDGDDGRDHARSERQESAPDDSDAPAGGEPGGEPSGGSRRRRGGRRRRRSGDGGGGPAATDEGGGDHGAAVHEAPARAGGGPEEAAAQPESAGGGPERAASEPESAGGEVDGEGRGEGGADGAASRRRRRRRRPARRREGSDPDSTPET